MERYLLGSLSAADKFVFETQLMLRPKLRMELYFQKKAYQFVQLYHRKKLKEELETLHQQIFNDPDNLVFQQNIYGLFK
jgi:hypothetical protein